MFNVGVYLLMICWIVKKITYEDDSLNFPNWKITVQFHETVAFRAMDNTLLARNVLCAISRWILELTNTHLSKPCLVVELPNYYLQRLLAENLTCPDSRWIVELTNLDLASLQQNLYMGSKRRWFVELTNMHLSKSCLVVELTNYYLQRLLAENLTCPDSRWIVELTNPHLSIFENFYLYSFKMLTCIVSKC